ncbi:tetrapyrrole biosynthesis, uroporphyrinogen III synthase [Cryphonectria parasitica EP155]|uniref:Tetrapyrrole biosynthesis, uroporphyrinogen III synthase n=1 Tax=Cryphonectria parasitica (strain ATCC 38755 / EP155) TaxID=660469 RepID=A0A9P5CM50_CRYP1|nr:tetrapyrrole biosynthesis, uroporphyrinogen III synthase [Cryphonectria parasitica EP155]KAF3763758.1 tetrapyrrole biosynthesis, uroporphyrinogen III synthase [Cryphonectria parasitica EP155]
MASPLEDKTNDGIPILLLKTKSTPGDGYEEIFAQTQQGPHFEPAFVPVLEHRFEQDGMGEIETMLKSKMIGRHFGAAYGGLVFTSQRAVEAFTKIVQDGRGGDRQWPHLCEVPVYSVGPATTRALKAVPSDPALQVFGEHTGNGDNLARFILDHYDDWYSDRPEENPALLFLVGEQRRDIIPKTLMNPELPEEKRIRVDEVVVYGTGVMESFADDFKKRLLETRERSMVWIVVFSPTGCDAMLQVLGLLDETTGKAKPKEPGRTRFIATIGPTTRDYLKRTFDFEPDVCSKKPSPEGVLEGIKQFMSQL